MRENLKKKINEQLGHLAGCMQLHSSSVLAWGEVDLPESLRHELEESQECAE